MKPTDNNAFDLDDLKNLWAAQMQSETESLPNNQEILNIMQQKKSTAVQRLQRNLLAEILVTIPLTVGAYFMLKMANQEYSPLTWCVFIAITFSYHIYMYWKLGRQEATSDPLVLTIDKQVNEMQKFMKMYDVLAIVAAILIISIPFIYAFILPKFNIAIFVSRLLLHACGSIGIYTATHWWANKLYGQHLNTLKD